MKPDAPSVSDLVLDDTMAPWALFHRRVKGRQGVYANLHDWADSVDGRQWQWYTLWNPLELEAFNDVWIIGNCFTQTVTFKLLSEFTETGSSSCPSASALERPGSGAS